MPGELQLELACDITVLRECSERVERFLTRHAVPPAAVYIADLALEELVSNIILHGQAAAPISIVVSVLPGTVTITIEDSGISFDPTQAPQPEPHNSAANARVGGYGIHMVRCVVEGMSYARRGDRNHLIVTICTG
ncbi:MAG: ATP-binding protein [Verrucomicrobia bacterium]|nr:ATP-binding protein [Verrucomicrobiota bacterium]